MTIRGIIVFVGALIVMRIGDRPALSRKTALDAVLIALLGSALARAINGSAPFLAPKQRGAATNLASSTRLCFRYRRKIFSSRLDFVAQRFDGLGQFLQSQLQARFYRSKGRTGLVGNFAVT